MDPFVFSSRPPATPETHTPRDTEEDVAGDPGARAGEGGDLASALSVHELALELDVSDQAIYDLRCRGRGPRGFRVGRHLRFRRSEIQAWLERLEADDAERHAPSLSDLSGKGLR